MALVASVTVVSVTEPQPSLAAITLNLTVTDDTPGASGIDQEFTVERGTGQSVADLTEAVRSDMQTVIDRYKRERAIADSGALETARASIESGLVV